MLLRQVDIANFRGIRQLSISLDETTLLIGENNVGKTTILDAIQVCLGRNARSGRMFSQYDYHLPRKDSQPSESEPIEITVHFIETQEEEWSEEVSQRLGDAIQLDDDGRQRVMLRTHSGFDQTLEDFVTTRDFIDLAGNTLVIASANRNITALQQLAPVFYLSAQRDSTKEFGPRAQFWSPFLRSLRIDDEVRRELEEELSELNQKILEANESFGALEESLGNAGNIVPLSPNKPVSIEAIPGRVFDILSRAQVLLTSMTGARLPIGQHGEGTQSLAVIHLFNAFLESRLDDTYSQHTTPILALEEPEAHLHPSAIRSVATLLHEFRGQKIIATHAGDMVAGSSLRSLRRLNRKCDDIDVHQLQDGVLTEEEIRKINYRIRTTRGDLLFARCWLLVEGETDRIILEGCAKVLQEDFVREGIGFVEYQQMGIGVDALIKFAECMGIQWFLVADGDQAGDNFVGSGRQQLGTRSEPDHIRQLDYGDMEVFLCMEGFGRLYEASMSPQKQSSVVASSGTLEYWEQVAEAQPGNSKTRNAVAVVDEMERCSTQVVPSLLREIVQHVLTLAREGIYG